MKLKFNLKEIRLKRNMSYRKLAELSKISTRTIANIEMNATPNIPLVTMLKLAQALNVEVSELYEMEEEGQERDMTENKSFIC